MAEMNGIDQIYRYDTPPGVLRYGDCQREFQERLRDYLFGPHSAFASEDEIAKAVGFSTRQYRRYAWRTFGEPAHSFVRRLRLEAAAGLLLTTDQDSRNLAQVAGYTVADSFVRAFRGHFGCRPAEFKRHNLSCHCRLPGFLLWFGDVSAVSCSVRISIGPSAVETYLYEGLILLARLDASGRIDLCPWRISSGRSQSVSQKSLSSVIQSETS